MAGRIRVSEPKQQDKPFQISKWVVWEAFQRVRANKGAAGSTSSRSKISNGIGTRTCIGSGVRPAEQEERL